MASANNHPDEAKRQQESFVWSPSPEQMQKSHMEQFRKLVGQPSAEALRLKAASEPDWFWGAVCEDLQIDFAETPSCYHRLSDDPTRPHWCLGGSMNIVTSCLDKWDRMGMGNSVALRYEDESGTQAELTYRELLDLVETATAVLRDHGAGPGTVVAIMMPMNLGAVVALLAVARCGAVSLPLFSGFGRAAIAVRLQESGAALVICSQDAMRRGKRVAISDALLDALPDCPKVSHVFVEPTNPDVPLPELAIPGRGSASSGKAAPTIVDWARLQQQRRGQRNGGHPAIVPCDEPLMLIFTSGTTGKPKGAIHSHCGFPIKAAQDMRHSMDLGPGDVLHWVTDIGWMMGPWEIFGALIGGVTLALYDGAPDYPDAGRLLRFVHTHKVTFLGISPPLARMMRAGGLPDDLGNLTESLRAIGSTGSPWDRDSWLWVFETLLLGTRPIINYSGGTEISGGILCGDWMTPLKPCSFAGPVLGMDADVFDAAGNPVRGQPGELVIKNHWIGMTRGFWNQDPRYHSTYWTRHIGVWTHGDGALIDDDGSWFITGRSDDTIKVAGKRLGPAEVESIVNEHPLVHESAAIGVSDAAKGEALVVFCVPTQEMQRVLTAPTGGASAATLKNEITRRLAQELGKPLAPREVWLTQTLPRTRNAKIMHRVVRAIYESQPLGELSSLENPESLDHLRSRV